MFVCNVYYNKNFELTKSTKKSNKQILRNCCELIFEKMLFKRLILFKTLS